jgi:ribonuclease BN (tRNA processing enzyme)
MSPFRFLVLGVGGAFSAKYYSSCFAVHAEGVWLLIDCPHPIRKILAEASATARVSLDLHDLHSVVLTHLHADHSSGVEGVGYFLHFALNRRAPLVMHPEVQERLWEGHLAAGMELFMSTDLTAPRERRTLSDYFQITTMTEERPAEVGPFKIECRKTLHSVPTTALRITAAGRTLGYSCDTAYDPKLIDWLASADRIIHETNLGIHTPYEKLAALPAELRRKMWLIHYPDDFEVDSSVIEPLRQGHMYDVAPPGLALSPNSTKKPAARKKRAPVKSRRPKALKLPGKRKK